MTVHPVLGERAAADRRVDDDAELPVVVPELHDVGRVVAGVGRSQPGDRPWPLAQIGVLKAAPVSGQ